MALSRFRAEHIASLGAAQGKGGQGASASRHANAMAIGAVTGRPHTVRKTDTMTKPEITDQCIAAAFQWAAESLTFDSVSHLANSFIDHAGVDTTERVATAIAERIVRMLPQLIEDDLLSFPSRNASRRVPLPHATGMSWSRGRGDWPVPPRKEVRRDRG